VKSGHDWPQRARLRSEAGCVRQSGSVPGWLTRCFAVVIAIAGCGCSWYSGPRLYDSLSVYGVEGAMDAAPYAVAPLDLRGRGPYLDLYLALQSPKQDLDRLATALAWMFYHYPNELAEIIGPDGEPLSFRDISREHRQKGTRINIHGTPKLVVPHRPPDTVRAMLACSVVPEQPLRPEGMYRFRLKSASVERELVEVVRGELAVIGDWRECGLVIVDTEGEAGDSDPWNIEVEG
jgi:hypothetical protein